jgi:hypothetical protein
MSLDNDESHEIIKSSRIAKKKHFSITINVNDNNKSSENQEDWNIYAKTPKEKKIFFQKKIKKNFFEENLKDSARLNEEDLKWYLYILLSHKLQEQITNLEKGINELLALNRTNFYLYDIKLREQESMKKEIREIKEQRNRTITEKAILANEVDFVKVIIS